ncbi:MAG: hypothetical protein KAX40_07565 [Herpetosiphon sp.]|nr:hypothetical protein [Herpetosiphon sp.]
MQRIKGIVVRGHRVASGDTDSSPYPAGTIAMQQPHFAKRGLDLSHLHHATLNIDIQPRTFRMMQPRWTFERVTWTDLHPPETFSFITCHLIFEDHAYNGWIYFPHPETKQTHFQAATVLEVLMPKIPNITYGSHVMLTLDPAEISIE